MALLLGMAAFAQSKPQYSYRQGYKFIRKANANIDRGNFKRAADFISRAKQSDYGFCGNAWASAYGEIHVAECRLLQKQRKYDEALSLLDSMGGCDLGADCGARDSLKVAILIEKFGKDKVKQAFAKIDKITVVEEGFDKSAWVLLEELHYKFYFLISRRRRLESGEVTEKNGNEFVADATGQPFYSLLD